MNDTCYSPLAIDLMSQQRSSPPKNPLAQPVPVGQKGSRRESPTRPVSSRWPWRSITRHEFSAWKKRIKRRLEWVIGIIIVTMFCPFISDLQPTHHAAGGHINIIMGKASCKRGKLCEGQFVTGEDDSSLRDMGKEKRKEGKHAWTARIEDSFGRPWLLFRACRWKEFLAAHLCDLQRRKSFPYTFRRAELCFCFQELFLRRQRREGGPFSEERAAATLKKCPPPPKVAGAEMPTFLAMLEETFFPPLFHPD